MCTWILKMPTLFPGYHPRHSWRVGVVEAIVQMKAISWNLARCWLCSYSPLGQLSCSLIHPPSVTLELKQQLFHSKQSVLPLHCHGLYTRL